MLGKMKTHGHTHSPDLNEKKKEILGVNGRSRERINLQQAN